MLSPEVENLIYEKSDSFIIPGNKVAFVQEDNPLMHAFLLLTQVRYAKIPVLDAACHITGLLSLPMITAAMIKTDAISTDSLNDICVKDVMQTDFDVVQADDDLEKVLHLLVDNAFLPVIDQQQVFQGILTRRELIKAFNYVVHTLDHQYSLVKK